MTAQGIAGPAVCPCVWCQVDAERGRPLRLAKWRDTGKFWAPYRRLGSGDGFVTRNEASLFGPRHARTLRANRLFVIVKPNSGTVDRARAAVRPA